MGIEIPELLEDVGVRPRDAMSEIAQLGDKQRMEIGDRRGRAIRKRGDGPWPIGAVIFTFSAALPLTGQRVEKIRLVRSKLRIGVKPLEGVSSAGLGEAEIMLSSARKCSDASQALVSPRQPPMGGGASGKSDPVSRAMNSTTGNGRG